MDGLASVVMSVLTLGARLNNLKRERMSEMIDLPNEPNPTDPPDTRPEPLGSCERCGGDAHLHYRRRLVCDRCESFFVGIDNDVLMDREHEARERDARNLGVSVRRARRWQIRQSRIRPVKSTLGRGSPLGDPARPRS